ncbi:MAG: TonB-dependent receptor [Azoarcus sp.]|nr:TonB-dependent receptor [Azoarcus sp.]
MKIHFSVLASACALVYPAFGMAQTAAGYHQLAATIVSATGIDISDTEATYASEVHRREEIERSGASTLVDYLARYTSVQVAPNFGNRFTPSINMRGYGSGDGHQNVVISVDGRRLNNIDMVPQLLGAIALVDIDRIEITKGSGSVMFGDGAMAGSIQIYTKPRDGGRIEVFGGSHGTGGGTLSAGLVRERFSLSATAEHSVTDGFGDKDPSGHRDESRADTWHVGATGKPVDGLKLSLDAGESRIEARYPNSLTLARFKDDPTQNSGVDYTHQKFDTAYWGVGADYELTAGWRLSARHHDEDKTADFVQFNSVSDYRYVSDEASLQYVGEALAVTTGLQTFDGVRTGSASETRKDNAAWYVQGQYRFDRLTLSAGARTEQVKYRYKPDVGAVLKDEERLGSWDIGANYRASDALTVFGNYNSAYQAPDIDRFFSFDWMTGTTSFNGFIEPARVRTVNLGLNHVTDLNRFKLTVFHARLRNEIYLEPFTFVNTNIDRSHKYGVEVQDSWRITRTVTGLLNYAWTRAIIDREADGGGAFEGKELPGVPRHNLVLGLNVAVGDHGNFNISHTWRSKTWAADDFDNNNAQKQREYQSTDLAYRHRVHRKLELFGGVSNLFEHKNGVWVRDDAIYPVDFERTWKLGARLSF